MEPWFAQQQCFDTFPTMSKAQPEKMLQGGFCFNCKSTDSDICAAGTSKKHDKTGDSGAKICGDCVEWLA